MRFIETDSFGNSQHNKLTRRELGYRANNYYAGFALNTTPLNRKSNVRASKSLSSLKITQMVANVLHKNKHLLHSLQKRDTGYFYEQVQNKIRAYYKYNVNVANQATINQPLKKMLSMIKDGSVYFGSVDKLHSFNRNKPIKDRLRLLTRDEANDTQHFVATTQYAGIFNGRPAISSVRFFKG